MLSKVQSTIAENRLCATGKPILVAVSGGADSMSLLFCLTQAKYDVEAAFFDHGWRDVSDERQLVLDFCEKLGIQCHLGKAEDGGKANEAEARTQRWAFLKSIANGRMIAVGHNANDRIETAIMNLTRGCGINGLTAMGYIGDGLIRPLLDIPAEEIRSFCQSQDIPFANDPTNNDASYRRNLIRQQLKPLIENVDPIVRSLNDITKEAHQLDQVDEYRLSLWQRKIDHSVEHLHGFRTIKLQVDRWESERFDEYVRLIFLALKRLRGHTHNISREFVKRIVSLALNTPEGKAIEQDVSCYTWRRHLYLILNFVEYEPWGPIEIIKPTLELEHVNSVVYCPFAPGILYSPNTKDLRYECGKVGIPPFVRNRVAIFESECFPKPQIIFTSSYCAKAPDGFEMGENRG